MDFKNWQTADFIYALIIGVGLCILFSSCGIQHTINVEVSGEIEMVPPDTLPAITLNIGVTDNVF